MSWFLGNIDLIIELTLNHIQLSIVPIVASFILSLPLGWLANLHPTLRSVVITGGSLLYTIPSLPLFVILPLILGTGIVDDTNLVVALSIYGVAIMTRSAADALSSVPATTVDAASAMGFSPGARFFRVELPLAGPVLLAGIRVVSVSTIALVSVGVIIGSRNLGYLFASGKARGILAEVVAGIVMSLLIALVFDLVIVGIGRLLMPWNVNSGGGLMARLRTRFASAAPVAEAGSSDGAGLSDEADNRETASTGSGRAR